MAFKQLGILTLAASLVFAAGCSRHDAGTDAQNSNDGNVSPQTAQHVTGQKILPAVPASPYNYTYGAAEITEFTSDNAPGTLFTIVRSREGVSTVSTPLPGNPAHSEFNVRSQVILPAVAGTPYNNTYGAAEITEFTSSSVPDELFTIVRSREGVSLTATALKR